MIDRVEIVARYCRERTVERRNAVVDAYRYLCARSARKFKRAHNDRADLEQVAAIGLIKAAGNYRDDMSTPFPAYARIMIVGELMHYTRDSERLVRLPRSLYDLEPRYAQAWDALAARHHREPTAGELAATLGVRTDVVAELHNARRCDPGIFPEPEYLDSLLCGDPLGRSTTGIALEERIALTVALDELADRERTIVLGTYGAGLTQVELARRLGLSQSHVSKLLSRALDKLGRRVA